jgi:hypothetical protein
MPRVFTPVEVILQFILLNLISIKELDVII